MFFSFYFNLILYVTLSRVYSTGGLSCLGHLRPISLRNFDLEVIGSILSLICAVLFLLRLNNKFNQDFKAIGKHINGIVKHKHKIKKTLCNFKLAILFKESTNNLSVR